MDRASKVLFHLFCLFGILHLAVGVTYLRCYKGSLDSYDEFPLSAPQPLMGSSCYDIDKPTVIYVFGFTETATSDSVTTLMGAYLENGTFNTILLNWEDKASFNTPVLLVNYASYVYAVNNTITVGNEFGEALVMLYDVGFSLSNLHVIGFSLGAQLSGYAGRKVEDYELIIGHITGLDPAYPLYQDKIFLTNLSDEDATYTDILHTDPGVYGTPVSRGDVDIWANCGSTQPGCANTTIVPVLFIDDACYHSRAWKYYAETVENRTSFPARNASSCSAWKKLLGTDKIVYLGEDIDKEARGNYYFRTNSESPYGLGLNGTQPSRS